MPPFLTPNDIGPLLGMILDSQLVKVEDAPNYLGGQYNPASSLAESQLTVGSRPDVSRRKLGEHEAAHALQDFFFNLFSGPELNKNPTYDAVSKRLPIGSYYNREGQKFGEGPAGISRPNYLLEQGADFAARTQGYAQPNSLEAMIIRALTNQMMREFLFGAQK